MIEWSKFLFLGMLLLSISGCIYSGNGEYVGKKVDSTITLDNIQGCYYDVTTPIGVQEIIFCRNVCIWDNMFYVGDSSHIIHTNEMNNLPDSLISIALISEHNPYRNDGFLTGANFVFEDYSFDFDGGPVNIRSINISKGSEEVIIDNKIDTLQYLEVSYIKVNRFSRIHKLYSELPLLCKK